MNNTETRTYASTTITDSRDPTDPYVPEHKDDDDFEIMEDMRRTQQLSGTISWRFQVATLVIAVLIIIVLAYPSADNIVKYMVLGTFLILFIVAMSVIIVDYVKRLINAGGFL